MTWSTNYGFEIYGTAIRWLSHDSACTMHRTTMTIITNWGKEILFTTHIHQVHVYIQLYFYNLIYCIINNLVCVSFIDSYHFPPSSGAQIRCQRSGFLPYLPAEALQSSVAATLVRLFFFFLISSNSMSYLLLFAVYVLNCLLVRCFISSCFSFSLKKVFLGIRFI